MTDIVPQSDLPNAPAPVVPESDLPTGIKVKAEAPKEKAAPESPSIPSEIGRQVGLTARYGIQGVTALPNMIGDALGLKSTKAVSHFLDALGFPSPKTPEERFAQSVTSSMAGAAGFAGTAGTIAETLEPSVAKEVASMLAAAPGAQVGSSAAGATAAESAKQLHMGEGGQVAAGLIGSIAPSAIASGVPAGIRAIMRGGESSLPESAIRIKRFRDLGIEPSPAQAFKTGPEQAAESYVARSPGGHKTMRDTALTQAESVGNAVRRQADELVTRSSPMMAGRAIEEGIKGDGGFLDKFKATSSRLFGLLDTFVPQDTTAEVNNTVAFLDKITKPIPGAENTSTSRLLVNDKIIGIRSDLSADLAGKPPDTIIDILGPDVKPISSVSSGGTPPRSGLPYYALKQLRSRVGELIADTGITSDIPRRQLNGLYAAISADMKTAVQKTGSDEGMRIFNRANAYVRAGHQRIDSVLQPLLNRDAPERIYQAALAGTKQGDTTIHSVMQSLPSEAQKTLASTVLRKMGIASPGRQIEEGQFSTQTFLTNWRAMSPEAKRSLFSRFGSDYVSNLNKIASTAADIVEAGSVYANPSGTAPVFYLQSTIGGAVIAALTGHLGIAGSIVGENALSYFAAKKITNPEFVNWLAKYSHAPISALPSALNELSQVAGSQQRKEEKKPNTWSQSSQLGNMINSTGVRP